MSNKSTKKYAVACIAKKVNCDEKLVKEIVYSLLDHIKTSLVEGQKIEFRYFGSFLPITTRQKIGRNPKKAGEPIIIPERLTVKFRPSKALLNLIRKD